MKKKKISNMRLTFISMFPQMIELIRLLASPYQVQISAFPEDEYPPEEIADEIDYKHYISEGFYKEGLISNEQYEIIKLIYAKFRFFEKEEWSIEAMKKSSNWQEIRVLATQALDKFNIEYAKPNIYWYPLITF